MNETIMDQAVEAVSCAGQDVTEGLKEIVLIPWGPVESKRGTMILDQAGAEAVVAAFEGHKTPLVIDYEHQTLGGDYSSPSGQAPAAGWVHRIWGCAGLALKGMVEWTTKAREQIRAGEYRFLSPVAIVEKETRRVVGLHSAALTNVPAIAGLTRVAASASAGQDSRDGQDAAIACAVREALGLPADAPQAAIELSIRTRSQDNAGLELRAMREAETLRLTEETVSRYVNAGRLNPNDLKAMSAARELACTQPDLLRAILDSPVCPQGRTAAPSRRSVLIAKASREWRGDGKLRGLCSLQAYCGQALSDAGQAELTADETRELAVI